MSSFADDIERLVKLHGVAAAGVKPLIEKAIEMLIEKERECRRVDFPTPCIPPMKPENPPFWWNIQPTCGGITMNLCKGETKHE